MSSHEKDILQDRLFSRKDKHLINIKFMRGTAEIIDPVAFRAEVCSMVAQRDNGLLPCGPIKSGRAPVDVTKMFA